MQDFEDRTERHRLARATQRLAQARRHARLKSELEAEARPQLDAILASTSWKVALLSRRIANLLPATLRKPFRPICRLVKAPRT